MMVLTLLLGHQKQLHIGVWMFMYLFYTNRKYGKKIPQSFSHCGYFGHYFCMLFYWRTYFKLWVTAI